MMCGLRPAAFVCAVAFALSPTLRASSVLLRTASKAPPELLSVLTYAGKSEPLISPVQPSAPLTVVVLLDTLSPAQFATIEKDLLAMYAALRKHPLPAWFQDAKFGIMLHWGLYSVPGFAARGHTFAEMLGTDYDHALTRGPYAEDYANQIKDPGSPAAQYHRENYGDAPYSDFVRQFDDGLAQWNPEPFGNAARRCNRDLAGARHIFRRKLRQPIRSPKLLKLL